MENRLKADFSKSSVWCLLEIVMQESSILGKIVVIGSKQWKHVV